MIRFDPIIPKRKRVVDAGKLRAALDFRMRTFAADALRECAAYEPPPSPSYTRTLTLKRSWSRKVGIINKDLVVEIKSPRSAVPYNVYAKGPKRGAKGHRQAAHMARRGWRSVTDIADQLWPNTRRDILRIIERGG